MLVTIVQVLALICFGAATVNAKVSVNLVAAGLFLWLLSTLIGG